MLPDVMDKYPNLGMFFFTTTEHGTYRAETMPQWRVRKWAQSSVLFTQVMK